MTIMMEQYHQLSEMLWKAQVENSLLKIENIQLKKEKQQL